MGRRQTIGKEQDIAQNKSLGTFFYNYVTSQLM